MRVSVLVGTAQVAPGNTLSVSGANGPDGKRNRSVTASVDWPGLNTSISELTPASSCAWGIAQWACGAATPGTNERPPEVPPGPTIVCTSAATTRPVRAVTTVLTGEVSCTSDATFSTAT